MIFDLLQYQYDETSKCFYFNTYNQLNYPNLLDFIKSKFISFVHLKERTKFIIISTIKQMFNNNVQFNTIIINLLQSLYLIKTAKIKTKDLNFKFNLSEIK
ncbi:unnamed protein product [Paramecium primaurelia]|uniref:Uncharacterized protein n=1 Tax=Paramecium primaurelia TaxID=5886 RepID=A0A8S1M7I4_PARPR|nr:unnamed protein product [Paramecium primaurelia]CAD8076071.1 unnamed protein product [Paramecium primaurelia]